MTELQTSTTASINEAFSRFHALGERNRDGLIDQINAAREIGMHLEGEKKKTPHGQWLLRFRSCNGKVATDYQYEFSYELGKLFMRLYRGMQDVIYSLPDAVCSLKDMMVAVGALPQSQRGEQKRHGPKGWFAELVEVAMELDEVTNREFRKRPLIEWPIPEVEQLEEQLRPLAQKHADARALLGI